MSVSVLFWVRVISYKVGFIPPEDKICVSSLAILFYETKQYQLFQFVFKFGMGNTYVKWVKAKCFNTIARWKSLILYVLLKNFGLF